MRSFHKLLLLAALGLLAALPSNAGQGMGPGPGISRVAVTPLPGLMLYFDFANKSNGNEGNFFGGDAWTSTESRTQFTADESFTLDKLRFRAITSTGVFHIITRINEAAGAMDATRSGAGDAEASGSDSIVSTNRVNLAYTSVGVTSQMSYIAANITFPSGSGNFYGSSNFAGATFSTDSVTRHYPLSGAYQISGAASEAAAQWRTRAITSVEQIYLNIESNTRSTDTVWTLRINEIDTALTRTVAGGVSGGNLTFSGGPIAVTDADRLSMKVVSSTGGGSIVINSMLVKVKSTNGKTETFGSALGFTRSSNHSTAHYMPIGGRQSTYFATPMTEAQVALAPRFASSVHNFRCYLGPNNYTGSFTLSLIKNGDTGSPAIQYTITSGTQNQWIGDTSTAVTINDTDTLSIEVLGGTSGNNMQLYSCGVTFSPLSAANDDLVDQPIRLAANDSRFRQTA